MTVETTLSIIKPDAVEAGNIGGILKMITDSGLKIKAMKMIQLSQKEAEGFYAVHKERPFFGELVEFMTSGPVVVSILEGENAISRYRELMGATNPEQAEEGTIRKAYATNIQNNAVHGSDAPETAKVETAYFFSSIEQVN
ncbi:nucleoside-diphosphate kinase [Salidesulfovibrio brasiliensis]|uniref:nucleoside-diphosphate kinase n=1 Tax=Salidesulfovibrio brasiliensis TaxID=221711 RepID=UPI0006D0DE26|nr:nucleoside-diphosphate kinase [Salidesulfovibrio brasiliensis]